MDTPTGLLLLLQLVLILLNAVFAAAEIAVLSVGEPKLDKLASGGNKKARRLLKLTQEPARFLATIQVAITLAGFLGSAFAAENFSDPLVAWLLRLGVKLPEVTLDTIAVVVITLLLSFITLVFGELVPKRIAMKKAEKVALGITGLVQCIAVVFRPLVWLLSVSTNGVLRLFGMDPNEQEDETSEEEILMMVDAGSEQGSIDEEEKQLIQNIFEFDDLTAGEIFTHRTDVVILWEEETDEDWAKTIHDFRHTLFPVCRESPDNVVGILNSKDYYRLDDKGRASVMENAVRPAYFVPETIKADVLFRNMKKDRISLAVVLDEYGGMAGIITLNDLVEELVGEFAVDESDDPAEGEPIELLQENVWQITGNVALRTLEDALDVTLEEEDSDTFTGLVFSHLGVVPADGEQDLHLQVQDLKIHVTLVQEHQVEKATVEKLPPSEEDEDL